MRLKLTMKKIISIWAQKNRKNNSPVGVIIKCRDIFSGPCRYILWNSTVLVGSSYQYHIL